MHVLYRGIPEHVCGVRLYTRHDDEENDRNVILSGAS